MNLLLIAPNIDGRMGYPPINIALLQAFVNQYTDHNAYVADLTLHKKDWQQYVIKLVEEHDIHLCGLSVLSFEYKQSMVIVSYLKRVFPHMAIIIGGVHAILKPEEVVADKGVDFVCTGEGEFVLKELLDNGLNGSQVAGLMYRENGQVVTNRPRKLNEHLDELPFPDWQSFDVERYFLVNSNHMAIMASRGCPYDCSYCNNHVLKNRLVGKYVRFRSVDNVLAEVEILIDKYQSRGMKYIYFIDDIFILKKEWVLEFCEKFQQRGFAQKIKWTANVRANLVTEEILSAMKGAGCYQVGMGIEAANDFIRNDIYRRNMSKEDIYQAVSVVKRVGLHLSTQFIIGAPYETVEMMEESLAMAREINADTVMFSILMPLPGTKIQEICEKEGLIKDSSLKKSQVMYSEPIIRSKFVETSEIKRFYRKIRNYQIGKYLVEGLRRKHLFFLWDLLVFLCYMKPKYDLEIQNAFKYTIKRYQLEEVGSCKE